MFTHYEIEVARANTSRPGELLFDESFTAESTAALDEAKTVRTLTFRNCVYEMGALSVVGPMSAPAWMGALIAMALEGGCRSYLLHDEDADIAEVIVVAGEVPLEPSVAWAAPEPRWMAHVAACLDLLPVEGRARQALVDLEYIAG